MTVHALRRGAAAAAGSRRRVPGQGLVQAAEGGNEVVQSGHREQAGHGALGGDGQPQLAALGQGPPVRSHQYVHSR